MKPIDCECSSFKECYGDKCTCSCHSSDKKGCAYCGLSLGEHDGSGF